MFTSSVSSTPSTPTFSSSAETAGSIAVSSPSIFSTETAGSIASSSSSTICVA